MPEELPVSSDAQSLAALQAENEELKRVVKLQQQQLSLEQEIRNLQETDVFVLDNSLRETTVASVYGHTIEGKYRILHAVRKAGMKHMLIGAFGPTRRVDEGFIQSLKDCKELREDEHYYAFSEFKDSDAPWFEAARKAADADEDVPYGLSVCKKLGIPNVVMEVDLMALWDLPGGVEAICKEMVERIQWCQRELSPDSKVFYNLRDFQRAWPKNPDRVLAIVEYLAKLPEGCRPFGLMTEDQNGSWLPTIMQAAVHEVRKRMLDNDWSAGHLLLHVHKGYGLSDSSQLAAIGAGATGIWCGVSANGAMTGHASSIMTLTNLARLGNPHVGKRFNFFELRNAAITIHQVCTNEQCPPYLQEVYGKGALDLVWGGGLMANQWATDQIWAKSTDQPFELQALLGITPRVRITTMTGPSMFLSKLTEFFATTLKELFQLPAETSSDALDAQWPRLTAEGRHIGHEMQALLHEDLRNMQRQNYNHELGLMDLYRRAYSRIASNGSLSNEEHERTKCLLARMQLTADEAHKDLDDHVLIKQLRAYFIPELGEEEDVEGRFQWPLDRFYPEFLEPFTHCMELAGRMFTVLDTDKSGSISYPELVTAAKWVIREFEATKTIDTVFTLVELIISEWVLPELAVAEMCYSAPAEDALHIRSEPELTVQLKPDGVQALVGTSVRGWALQDHKTTLVAFYDPECPHCQELLPVLDVVAAAMAGDPTVVFGKMDVTRNTVPEPFEVTALPTIYFKAAGGFPWRYRGIRHRDALLNLIKTKRAIST